MNLHMSAFHIRFGTYIVRTSISMWQGGLFWHWAWKVFKWRRSQSGVAFSFAWLPTVRNPSMLCSSVKKTRLRASEKCWAGMSIALASGNQVCLHKTKPKMAISHRPIHHRFTGWIGNGYFAFLSSAAKLVAVDGAGTFRRWFIKELWYRFGKWQFPGREFCFKASGNTVTIGWNNKIEGSYNQSGFSQSQVLFCWSFFGVLYYLRKRKDAKDSPRPKSQ